MEKQSHSEQVSESASGDTDSQFEVPDAASHPAVLSTSSGSGGSTHTTTVIPAVRLGLAHSLLNFPSPHQLGKSTGIRKSKSLKINLRYPDSGASTSQTLSPDMVNETLRRLSEEVGIEETDYGQPSAKRPKLQSKVIITTYDGEPLKEFSLFLPSKLPAAIPNNPAVLQEFVFKITATYLRLWNLAPDMDCIEIRLPAIYDEKFSSSSKFLKDFIDIVFQQLNRVQSIGDLYLPKMDIQRTTNLDDILAGMLGRASVSHLYLPLVSSLDRNEIRNYSFKSFAFFLHALNINQITVVSTDDVIGDFCKDLSKELGRIHRCSVQLVHRNEELAPPGPNYIVSLNEDGGTGEFIKPSQMVQSMNVYSVPKHYSRIRDKEIPKKPKMVSTRHYIDAFFITEPLNALHYSVPATISRILRRVFMLSGGSYVMVFH